MKRERFSHLRENPENFSSLCPLNIESIEFVCAMIDQHMNLLSGPDSSSADIPYIHIGADEVFNLATCKNCRFQVEETGVASLYAKFVRKVCKHLKKNYPSTQILLWDDMFRQWQYQDLQRFRLD